MVSTIEFEKETSEDMMVDTHMTCDIPPDDLWDKFSPKWDIQHAINLVPGSVLSSFPPYQVNPTENTEMQRQFDKLLGEEFNKESLSWSFVMCVMPALFTSKNNGMWRTCGHILAIQSSVTPPCDVFTSWWI